MVFISSPGEYLIEMVGWIVPPPKTPEKTSNEFLEEREKKVRWLIQEGFMKSESIIKAMLKVPREEFIPEQYRDYAYLEVPFPLPGREATISCPHSYPLFYEALELKEGEKLLEVGTGSGYGAALAREIVGSSGKVVTIEIDEDTLRFAEQNMKKLGYDDVDLVHDDGSLGHAPEAPYDKICITASCPEIPSPLIEQLKQQGRLITPVGAPESPQDLVLVEKSIDGTLRRKFIVQVLYVPLKGKHGWFE
ncbi:MAG: protein-L-isoaspartate O-methyltransferase [Candidatus Sifarchaeia archaeon]